MYLNELKRKLRSLKKLEVTIRFGNKPLNGKEKLVWDEFFSTKEEEEKSVRYGIKQLVSMEHEKIKEIFDEFFYYVYFRYYNENGITSGNLYDPKLLAILGLSELSSAEDIRKRFRELALKYHPDKGGDSEKFMELLDAYKRLVENQ